jgi:hypothetical protein
MCGVWRVAVICYRFPLIGVLFIALPLLLISSNAFAQSSELSVASQATARSILDAVSQNENGLIAGEVHGSTSGAGTVGAGAFSSGRLKTSAHGGLSIRDIVLLPGEAPGVKTFAYATDEASVFANVVATVPGTVLGGQLKFSGFVGYNWLSLHLKSNAVKVLDPDQSGSADNGSVIVGGTALWSMQSSYALATIVGTWGETKLVDTIDDCGNPGCITHRYAFDTSGYIGRVTAGNVFALSASPSGPKLDVRGSVGYTRHNSESFSSFSGNEFKVNFATWTGTAAVTLFANLAMPNDAVLRPYVQGYVRQEFGYNHKLAFTENQGPSSLTAYEQSHTYPGLDAGLTYAFQNMTLGGSLYFEGSADEHTLGGRVSASWKLN